MRIGELARTAGVTVETVRYYERAGLLPRAGRATNNYRSYPPLAPSRLQFVRRCRALGMSLAEIAALLRFCDEPQRHCDGVEQVLEAHIAQIQHQLDALALALQGLRQLRAACNTPGAAARCAILRTLQRPSGAAEAGHALADPAPQGDGGSALLMAFPSTVRRPRARSAGCGPGDG